MEIVIVTFQEKHVLVVCLSILYLHDFFSRFAKYDEKIPFSAKVKCFLFLICSRLSRVKFEKQEKEELECELQNQFTTNPLHIWSVAREVPIPEKEEEMEISLKQALVSQ